MKMDRIRKYKITDLEDVLDAWYSASQVGHPFLEQKFLNQEREIIRNQHLTTANIWVYLKEDKVVAFIAMLDNEVGGIFVHSDQQRHGIGKKLLDYVAPLHKTLELNVFEKNDVGRQFYQKYGFYKVSEEFDKNSGQKQFRLRYEC